jgi:parallel beta-helix repeat protein
VDGSGSPVWRIGLYNTGTGSRILNNYIHHIHTGQADCPENGGAGAESDGYYGARDGEIESNLVHDIGSSGCILFHGIYHTHDGAVRNNVVRNVSGWGIALWHAASDVTIVNNTVFENRYGGITIGADLPNTADYVTVANNLVYGNRYGIVEFGSTGIHNVYKNNLLHDNLIDWKLQNALKPEECVRDTHVWEDCVPGSGGDGKLSTGCPGVGAASEVSPPPRALSDAPRPQCAVPHARVLPTETLK